MNCPQCQTANGPQSAFCGNCGAQLTVAPAAAPAAAPGGYPPPQGAGTPPEYAASGAPTGYGPPQGYDAAGGYNAPGGFNADGPTQAGGYPQGQYQPPAGGGPQAPRPSSLPPVNFDHNRLDRVDKIVAGATFITMISIWLPWYSISFGASTFEAASSASISGTTGHGWLWLEFIVAIVLLAYLTARAAWDRLPITMPVAHAPLLIVGTSLQLLLVLIAFIAVPYRSAGVGWDWGAFIALLAALAAAGPVVVPAVRSYRASRNGGGAPRSY